MADERVVTELTIDARGAEVGSAEYVRAMNAAQAAVDRLLDAEARAAAAQAKQAAPMGAQAQNIGKIAAAYDKLRASVDPIAKVQIAAQEQLNRALLTTDAAVKRGLVTQEQASATIAALKKKQLADIEAVRLATEGETAAVIASERVMETAKEVALGLVGALGATAAFTALAELPEKIKGVVEQAAGLANTAQVIGITTKALQELQYAGELNDVSTENMTSALERFSKNLGGAAAKSSALGQTFRANHVVISGDLMTDMMSFANLVEHASTAAEKNKLITDAFGKGAANMGLLFENGAAGLKEFMAEADKAGTVIDGKMLVVARELDDQFKTLQLHSETAFKQFAISVAPALLLVLKDIGAAADFVSSHFDTIAAAATIAGAAIVGYFGPATVMLVADLTVAIGKGLVGAIWDLDAAMLANPIGLLIGGVAAAIAAAVVFRDQIKQLFGIDTIAILKDAANALIRGFLIAFATIQDMWNNLPAVIGDAAIKAVNWVIDGVNKMISGSIDGIRRLGAFIGQIPWFSGNAATQIANAVDGAQIKPIDNPFANQVASTGAAYAQTLATIRATDYAGSLGDIASAAMGAGGEIDKLNKLLGDGGAATKLASDGTDKLRKSYDELLLSVQQKIASSTLERQSIGLAADAALKLRNEQDILQDAQKKGIDLDSMTADGTRTKRAELLAYADQLTATTIETRRLQDAQKAAQAVFKSIGDTIGEVFSGGIKSIDEFVDHLLTSFAKIGQDNLGKLFSGDSFNALFGNVTGGGIPANDNKLAPGLSVVGGALPVNVKNTGDIGKSFGDLFKNNPQLAQGLSAAVGGLGIGYQTQNPLMGAVGGALSGAAVGGVWGAVAGGIAGLIGGFLGMNEAIEKAKQAVKDNTDAINTFIATGFGDEVSKYATALAQFNAQGQKLLDLAKQAGDSALEGKLNAAIAAYPATLAQQLQDDLDRQLNSLNGKDYLNAIADAQKAYNQTLANGALLGIDVAGKANDILAASLKKIAADASLTSTQILALAVQFPALANSLYGLLGVVGGASIDQLQADKDKAESDLRDVYQAQAQAIQANIDQGKRFIASLKDIKSSLTLDTAYSPLSPYDRLQAAAAEFASVSQAAAGTGDDAVAAQNKLQDTVQTYLSAARDYYGTSEAYMAIWTQVNATINQLSAKATTQVSADQMQLDALNTQVGQLINLNSTMSAMLTVDQAIANYLAASSALAAGQAANQNGSATSTAVNNLYESVLGRAPDAAGAAYWQNQINNSPTGQVTGDIASAFIAAALANGETVDPTLRAIYGMANGGWVTGGRPGLDSVPRLLMQDEHVMPRGPALRYAPQLDAMRNGTFAGSNDNADEIRGLRSDVAQLQATLVNALGQNAAVVAGSVKENTTAVQDQTRVQGRMQRNGTTG